jgi:hypothetical protein
MRGRRIRAKEDGSNAMRLTTESVFGGGNKTENLVVGVVHDSHPSCGV